MLGAVANGSKEVIILHSQDLLFCNILQIAKMVTSESPQSGGERGIALDDLISSLDFNPFLTRKQIPRTPENLRKSKMLCLCNMLSLMTNVASSLTLYVSHKKKRIIHSVKLHGTLTAHLCNTG